MEEIHLAAVLQLDGTERGRQWNVRLHRGGRGHRRHGGEEEHQTSERRECDEQRDAGQRQAHPGRVEDRSHAAVKLRALDHADGRRQCQRQPSRAAGNAHQKLRIARRRPAGLQHGVVTRLFLELSRLGGGEPHQRVIPMHRAGHVHDLRGEVVEPTDVCELVQQGEAALRLGPVGARGGKQHDWPHEPPGTGTGRAVGLEHAQGSANSRFARDPAQGGGPRWGKIGPCLANPANQADVGQGVAQAHAQCTDEPDDQCGRPRRTGLGFRGRESFVPRIERIQSCIDVACTSFDEIGLVANPWLGDLPGQRKLHVRGQVLNGERHQQGESQRGSPEQMLQGRRFLRHHK